MRNSGALMLALANAFNVRRRHMLLIGHGAEL
jgi:hypothetical protein